MLTSPLIGFVLLFILALVFFWFSSRQRQGSGLPGGRIIYEDTRGWGRVEKPLYDPELELTGKPDYLVEQGGRIIPVEVKSGRAPAAGPYDTHIFQLAAYCLLVERCLGKRPSHGILHYANRTYAIDFTPALETALLDILAQMRIQEKRGDPARSHDQAARCVRCGYNQICNQRLP